MSKPVSIWTTAALRALVFVVATGTAISAQQVMTTVVGKGETIAVAYDPNTGTVYYAGDRPGAIYSQTSPYGGVLVAGKPGGSIADGIAAGQAAVFPGRNGLAVDAGGNLFLSEPALRRIRRIDAQTGVITTIAGTTNNTTHVDSSFSQGNNAVFTALAAPGALAFNPVTGDLYVADETWDVVYRITGNGSPITSSNGFIYRAVGGDTFNTSIYVGGFYNPYGYAGDNGPAIDAKLNHPRGLAFDGYGNLFIADTGNNVIRYVDAASNTITTIVGNGVPGFAGDGGQGASAELFMPTGVVVLQNITLYIADTSNHRVREYGLSSHQIFTFAGDGVARFNGNSYAFPTGIATDGDTRLFVVDSQNRSISASDITSESGPPNIEIAHIGDSSDAGYIGDGAPGGEAVNRPTAIAFDVNRNAFFADSGNSRVRRMDAVTHVVTTVVGNGIPGYDGDNADALHARLNCPAGLAFGAAGELFVSDTCANVVRRVSPGADSLITGAADEIITTYAGTGVRYGYSDGWGGQATAARLNAPGPIAFSGGTLYVGEPNISTIATIAPSGTIDYGLTDIDARAFTVDPQGNFVLADAGSRDLQCNGQEIVYLGGSITLWGGVAADASGRLFASADAPGQIVYRFQAPGGGSFCSATAAVDQLALAGNGAIGYSGDNGPATAATLNQPAGLAVDASGNVWIADMGNNAIRRAEQPTIGVTASPASLDFGTQALQTTSSSQIATATSSGTAPATFTAASLSGANPGDFFIVNDGCSGTVAASGVKCQVSVAFKPTAAGARSAVLQFNDNGPDSPQTVNLVGGAATLDVSPSTIAIGSQTELLASSPLQVTVTNRGGAAVSIVSLSFTGQNVGDFSIVADGCTNTLLSGGGGSCTFGVVFTPQDLGSRMTTLAITSSATDLVRQVTVTGTGTPPVPSASIAPLGLTFTDTTVGGTSASATFTVTSNGTAPLTITGAGLTGNQPQDFKVTGDSCTGVTLMPSQTCTVSVAFTPVDVCFSKAAVTLTDNASDSPQSVTLTGHGVMTGGPFQAVPYCTSHAAQPQELAAGPDGNVWFDERGSVFSPGAIGKANAQAGVISEDPNVVQPGWHPSALAIASDGSYAYLESRGGGFGEWYDIVNPLGLKIQQPNGFPGPSGVGPDHGFWLTWRSTCGNGNFVVTHFAPNGATTSVIPDVVWMNYNMKGKTCLAPSFAAAGPDGLEWIATSNAGTDVGVQAPNGFVRVTTDNVIVDFTPTDAPAVAATVGPDGNMWALMANLAGGGCSLEQLAPFAPGRPVALDPSLFALGCFSIASGPDHRLWMTATTSTIKPSGLGFVQAIVAYNPASGQWSVYPTTALASPNVYLAAGPDEGIWFDAIPSAVARLDMGGGPSKAYVTPATMGFPSTILNLPAGSQSIVVRSAGTASLTISGVALAGADSDQFRIQNNGCLGAVLSPGQACTIQVTSLPTKQGNHVAKVVISDNDAFSPQVVGLAEFTLPPVPTISPISPSFPNATVGTHGKTVTFTLTNPNDRTLSVSVSTSGANASDFTILNNTCQNGPVAAKGTCTVDVRFDPTAAGRRQAQLNFSDNATPPTQSVTLTATGEASTGGGGTSCTCNSNGNFVDPTITYPAVAQGFGASGGSPHGAYTLEVRADPSTGKPSAFLITKQGATTPFVTINAPTPSTTVWATVYPWGFSPDDDRFVLHYATFQISGNTTTDWEDTIVLYDLKSSTPGIPVSGTTLAPVPIAPEGSGTGTQGSVAFSPHGAYVLTAQLQSTSSGQTIVLNVVTSGGARVYQHVWNPASVPADPEDEAASAFWGFSPDEKTFAYYLQEPGDQNYVELINLPTGTLVHEIHDSATKDLKVQFAPCGEVIAVVYTDATAPVDAAETNPVHVALYSTQPGSGIGAIFDQPGLPTNETIVVTAGTAHYYVTVNDGAEIDLAPNTSTGPCPSASTSGDAGGSDAPAKATAPTFKTDYDTNPPPLTATLGQQYSFTFEADGSPDPTFGLITNTCSFLSIDANTGEVSGTPKDPFTSCEYAVRADNGFDFVDTKTFTVLMAAAPGGGSGGGGPSAEDDDIEPTTAFTASRAASETTSTAPSQQTTLVLPHGRGQVVLNADVTPSVSTFTYTEIDLARGTGKLLFAGLHFSLTAVDAASGTAVTSLVDPPIAKLVYFPSDLQSARIGDPATLGVYWWNGTAWINQLPCAGCGVDTASNTVTVLLSEPGEYMLAAAQPAQTITVTGIPVSAAAGAAFSGPVASFAPLYPSDLVGFYSASVTWGDGQTSDGQISLSGGSFVISSSHSWTAGGTYTIRIAVVRGESGGTTQTTATVSLPPAFTAATPPLTATVGSAYSYGFAASGAPAPAFALGSGAPSWLTINATTGVLSGTPPSGTTSFSYSVVASNGIAPSATAGPFTVTVNAPPAFTAVTPPLIATVGTPYSYGFAASGNPAPTFALGTGAPSWLTITATAGAVSGTPPAGTTSFSYSVVASNGIAPNATAGPFTVTVNAPPAFTTATPPLTATVGTPYSYGFAASGVPAPAFSLGSGAPSWLTINATTGVLSGTPPSGTTSFSYGVVASNGITPNATAGPFTVSVSAPIRSADLSVTMTAPTQASNGSTITYSIVVTNNGPGAATNVSALLLAGPGLSFVSASPAAQLSLDGVWAWKIARLDPGQSVTLVLRAKTLKNAVVLAVAVVGSDTPDPKLANNAAAKATTVK